MIYTKKNEKMSMADYELIFHRCRYHMSVATASRSELWRVVTKLSYPIIISKTLDILLFRLL